VDEQFLQRARDYRANGYNCAQAVACAFLPLLTIDECTLFKVTEGFGGGMGGTEGTCGAISGAIAATSLYISSGSIEISSKSATYAVSKKIFDTFVEKNKSSICKDLRGLENGVELRSCLGCIEDAVLIAQKVLGIE